MARKHRFLCSLIVLSGLTLPINAFAYIDPGTGNMILQGLIAALAGIAITAKLYWNRIKAFFVRRKTTSPDGTTSDTEKGASEDK